MEIDKTQEAFTHTQINERKKEMSKGYKQSHSEATHTRRGINQKGMAGETRDEKS